MMRYETPADPAAVVEALVDVYSTVFAEPPYNEGDAEAEQFRANYTRDAASPEIGVTVARDDASTVVGFAYGSASHPAGGGNTAIPKHRVKSARRPCSPCTNGPSCRRTAETVWGGGYWASYWDVEPSRGRPSASTRLPTPTRSTEAPVGGQSVSAGHLDGQR